MTTTTQQANSFEKAPDFRLLNHQNIAYNLSQVMGENGLLMVFAGDVWDLGCIRNVLWLQRQIYKLSLHGINAVVIVPNHTYDVSGFFLSIPRKIPFPMLADIDGQVYDAFNVNDTGFFMLDRDGNICNRWHLKVGVVPHIGDILHTIDD